MADPYSDLESLLAQRRRPYEALTPLGGVRAQVRFLGIFQGRRVVWDAEILALLAGGRENPAAGAAPAAVRPFIDIGEETGERGVALRVGLAVSCVDGPTVLRTIIMIRNYRRLRAGRHEFGEALPDPRR